MKGIPRSPWFRAALVLPFLAAVVVLLWWRGPDWNVVYHAFDLVNWAWIAFALGLNLVSVLLRAWPEVRRRTGARLRIAGADPLAVRLLLTRLRIDDDGIDVLGFLSQEDLTAELASAKALVAPSLGGESFGMVLTRAFACATPVVASDISGYRDVMTPETSVAVAPGEPAALADAVTALLEDEPRREALGTAARQLAIDRYSWADIARRLDDIYASARGVETPVAA